MISDVVNVRYDDSLNDVIINSDPGRIRRPLVVVNRNNKLTLKNKDVENLVEGKYEWGDLIEKGIIEYIDAEEEENCLIALNEGIERQQENASIFPHGS